MNVETHKKPVNLALHHLKMDIKKATLQSEDEEQCEEMYGGCSDRSIEFTMLECQAKNPQQSKQISIERDIIEYLKYLGLKMKTDPKAKQDRYYQKLKKNRIKRAQTMIEEEKLTNTNTLTMTPPSHKKQQISIKMNSILVRRSPDQSGGSSPLISIPIEKNTGKSRFSQLKQESPKSDTYIQNDDIQDIYKF